MTSAILVQIALQQYKPKGYKHPMLYVKMPFGKNATLEDVAQATLKVTGLTNEQLRSKRRFSELIRARQLVVHTLYSHFKPIPCTLRQLADRLGTTDYTMPIYARKVAKNRYEVEPDFKRDADAIIRILKSNQ